MPGGLKNDSTFFSGALIRKNVAHKKMKSKLDHPRILILKFALEYQRVENKYSILLKLLLIDI